MLDVHQLNVFLVSAETLSFTQAAQRLHMTQPSVSQHIQGLEHHFDMQLFLRTGRALELTEAGLALLPLAREAVELSIRIDETMESLKGKVFGHLMVGCILRQRRTQHIVYLLLRSDQSRKRQDILCDWAFPRELLMCHYPW